MVYSTCLENKRVARHRGFESLPLRQVAASAQSTVLTKRASVETPFARRCLRRQDDASKTRP